jgi:hypothetical protein
VRLILRCALFPALFALVRMSAEDAPTLCGDSVRRVLRSLDGDVATLCAAACVCRAWRAEVCGDSLLWADFSGRLCLGPRVAERLTDARLAALVTRAAGGLRRLDLTSCPEVSVEGVLAALHGHPKLSLLHVRGVRFNPPREQQPADDEAPRLTLEDAHRALRVAVMAQRTDLDARRPWFCSSHDGGCGRLCRGPRNWSYEPYEDDWPLDSDGESDGSDVMSQGDGCADCDEPCGHVYCHVCVAEFAAKGEQPCRIKCAFCEATVSRSEYFCEDNRLQDCTDCGCANVCSNCNYQRWCAGKCWLTKVWRCPPCAQTAVRACGACNAWMCMDDCHAGWDSSTCVGDGCAVLVCGTCTNGAWSRQSNGPESQHPGCKDVVSCPGIRCGNVYCPACAAVVYPPEAVAAGQQPHLCRDCVSGETARMIEEADRRDAAVADARARRAELACREEQNAGP